MAMERAQTADSTGTSPGQSQMDIIVGYLLLIGVVISLALLLAGMIWKFASTGRWTIDYQISGMNLFEFVSNEMAIVIRGQLRPRVLVSGGIVVLMLTPYFRVLASTIYFIFVLKNWKYSLFTGIVLAVLTFSLFLR